MQTQLVQLVSSFLTISAGCHDLATISAMMTISAMDTPRGEVLVCLDVTCQQSPPACCSLLQFQARFDEHQRGPDSQVCRLLHDVPRMSTESYALLGNLQVSRARHAD